MRYVAFNTNLNLLSKKKNFLSCQSVFFIFFSYYVGIVPKCEEEQILLIMISTNLNFRCVTYFVLKSRKLSSLAIFVLLSIFLFSIAVTPATCTLCIVVFQIRCLSFTKNIPYGCQLFSLYCQMISTWTLDLISIIVFFNFNVFNLLKHTTPFSIMISFPFVKLSWRFSGITWNSSWWIRICAC